MSFKVDSIEIESGLIAPAATTGTDGLMSSSDKTKLDGVATGATANSSDATLLNRANHTGTQLASTISDFTSAASVAAPVQSVAGQTGAVTLTKADVGLSNVDNTSDLNKPVSTAQASADTAIQSYSIQRINHTGTQAASTISDFSEAVDDRVAALLTAGTNISLSYDDTANTLTINSTGGGSYTNEDAQDAVGGILTDTATIDFTYDDVGNTITADIKTSSVTNAMLAGSIDATKIDGGLVTNTEFNYLDGVTGSIQTQLDGKANLVGGNTFTNKQVMTPDATNPGLNIGVVATDPSTPSNGDTWYNSTSHSVKTYRNGVTIDSRELIAVRTLTSGTTYTPTAGTTRVKIRMIGGGGGGGGVTAAATSIGAAAGGGAGAYLEAYVALTGAASYTYAIGAAGTGATAGNNTGGTGGTTSITIGATTYSCTGGVGGAGQAAGTAVGWIAGGAGGTATNGDLNITGGAGCTSMRVSGTAGIAGSGSDSLFGRGGQAPTAGSAGNTGVGYGSGGGGAFSTTNAGGNRAGGTGTQGLIIIEEYA